VRNSKHADVGHSGRLKHKADDDLVTVGA